MTLSRPVKVVAALGACTSLVLQGCGGGGGSTPAPTPAPTPQPTRKPFSDPMTADEAAKKFNEMYTGFDETNDNSPLGLIISMAADQSGFWKNIYCSTFKNPVLGTTGCSLGRTDCRMSASLYNHKMLVNKTLGTPLLGLGRPTGFVFDLKQTQEYWGKCSYIWDGASDKKYNTGCGLGASVGDCSGNQSAYGNVCPSTGKICTQDDVEVKSGFCSDFGGQHDYPRTHSCTGCDQCAIPGPAINYHLQPLSDWTPAPDHLRTMAKKRASFSDGSDYEGSNLEKWNEVVLDEHLMLPKMMEDPAVAVPAIVYLKGHKQTAEAMRDDYCKGVGLEGDKKIPIVAIDGSVDVTNGGKPFFVEAASEREEIV